MSERRKFSRITFSGLCSLTTEISGEVKRWQSKLVDISLKGALLVRPETWIEQENISVQLSLQLQGSDIILECDSVICHQDEEHLGIKFLTLSLESISHLKRLIQLNLADENLLHREMSELINISGK